MSFNYDELYSRYLSWVTNGDGSQDDLLYRLDGDIENWQESDCDRSELTGLCGVYTYDEVIWLYDYLNQAVSA